MSRISRLFELISVLRARRRPATAADLASELGISQRSIYRDIETLRSLGAPLDGQAGIGFQLREGFFLPELAFSPDELDALLLGLGWVQQRADASLVKASESALAKVLAARKNLPVANGETPALIAAASRPEATDPPQTATLRDAIRRQRKVSIRYTDSHGTSSNRIVWPIAIVYFENVRLLAAWCEHRSGFRNFRVDRLKISEVLDDRYPGRRQSIVTRWLQQDRDWRSLLTVSDTPPGYPLQPLSTSDAMSKEK